MPGAVHAQMDAQDATVVERNQAVLALRAHAHNASCLCEGSDSATQFDSLERLVAQTLIQHTGHFMDGISFRHLGEFEAS